MAGYAPILGVLAYVLSPDRRSVLLVHRVGRDDDQHLGKYNGLGGKVERDEDVVGAMRRELREEAGIEAIEMRLRGTVSWPGFGVGGEDWFGFVFLVERYDGTPVMRNPEGELSWEPVTSLLEGSLPLWEGDRHFLPLVFDDSVPSFHGVLPYLDGNPVSWDYSVL